MIAWAELPPERSSQPLVKAIFVRPEHVSGMVEMANHTELHLISGKVLYIEGGHENIWAAMGE